MMDSINVTSHHQYTIQNTIIELLQHFINYLVKFSTAAQHASNHTLNKAKFACMFYRLSGYVIPITNMVKKHISSRCFVNLMISTPLLHIQSGTLVYPGTRSMLHTVALLKFNHLIMI